MISTDKNIKTIIFDCFGVIADPILSFWYRDNYVNKGFVDTELPATLRRFDLGQLTEDDIFDRFSKYDGVTVDKEIIKIQADAYTKLNDDLINLIGNLRTCGYEIVLLTNANHSYFERKIFVDFPDFKDLFDHIIISSRVKMVKPDLEIFQYTLKQIGKNPNETVFIDDNTHNVEAAEKIGIHGHVYSSVNSLIEHLKYLGVSF